MPNSALLLPALYHPEDEAMRCNFAARVDGRLAAVVGCFPIAWQVGVTVLKIGDIGGVAGAHNHRRTGLMRDLLRSVKETMIAEGCQLSFLGGQRQRYRYCGWEVCGQDLRLLLTPANLRHAFGDQTTGLTVRPLQASDTQTLPTLRPMQESRHPPPATGPRQLGRQRPHLSPQSRRHEGLLHRIGGSHRHRGPHLR